MKNKLKNKIVVIFSSHLGEEKNNEFINHIHNTIGVKHDVICYENYNQYSLTEIYNKAIDEFNEENIIMVFCHPDIIIKTKNWGRLLLTKFNNTNFDIIGVAGTTYLSNTGRWWDNTSKMCGIVEHTDGYNTWVSKYSEEIPNVKDVVLIDGLFMSFNPDTIIHKFDEEFKGYHLYDLSFCVPNYLDGCNLGVTTAIRILHKSIGQTNQEWENNREQFVLKYKDELPITIYPTFEDNFISLSTQPKVSVIIPTKNHASILIKNINSWNDLVNYENYEIIIADTGSDEETINKYNEILSDKVKLVRYNYYNFGKINNDVVKNYVSEDTELILFCNDDIKLINDTLSRCIEVYNKNINDVGTIGIRLHYADASIQHNGITIIRDNTENIHLSHIDIGKIDKYLTNVDYNSLGNTGGFMLIKKELFIKIGGFNENYLECLEDVELNLKCKLLGFKNITVRNAVAFHYESLSRRKLVGSNERFLIDFNRLSTFISFHNIIISKKNVKFPTSNMLENLDETNNIENDILVNIITRTHDRPNYFKLCKESILNQTYKNINHIVGSDIECNYCDNYIQLHLQEVQPKPDYLASYPAPWNLHLNMLNSYVKNGWIMYLDDDDKFVNTDALSIIINNIENEDQIILWRVDINGMIVPNNEGFGKIIPGNISGIGFMFHSKHLPVDWGSWNFGDYRVISQLISKNLQQKWINLVLTQTQGKPNFGQKPIDL